MRDKTFGPPRPARAPSSGTGSAWMLTLSDLVCLMLTFFVMTFAMSEPDNAPWKKVISALNMTSDPFASAASPTAPHNVALMNRLPGKDLDYLAALLEEQLALHPELSHIRLTKMNDRIALTVAGDLLFAPNQAELTENGQKIMVTLGGTLARLGNRLEVAGHTDPSPIHGGIYASNWELSLARAEAAADMLRRVSGKRSIAVRGYAESRFERFARHADAALRQQFARRVDIIIHADGDRS